MERRQFDNFQEELVKGANYPLYFLYILINYFYNYKMYGLYDKQGILRFIDSDKDACIAYAELFELSSTNYCLMDLANDTKKVKGTNLDQNLGVSNN